MRHILNSLIIVFTLLTVNYASIHDILIQADSMFLNREKKMY